VAATESSLLVGLAGPAEGAEGGASAHESDASGTREQGGDAAGEGQQGQQSQEEAGSDAANQQQGQGDGRKDTPEEIERKHLGALHEAREQNRQLKSRIAELEAQSKLTPEDRAALDALRSAKTDAENEEPDFLTDPKGYVDSKVAAALKKLDEQKKDTDQTKETVAQKEAREALWRDTQTAEATFVSTTPDYPQALQHIRTVRVSQLKEMFPEATDQQIVNHMAYEEMQAAQTCLKRGRSPAEYAYKIAQTMGYKPAAKGNGAQGGGGTTATNKQPSQRPDKDAARTMGSGGGDQQQTEDQGDDKMPPEFTAALSERFKRPSKK
jgi:hypothetical protein